MYVKDQLSEQVSKCSLSWVSNKSFIQSRDKGLFRFQCLDIPMEIVGVLSQLMVIIADLIFFFGSKQFIIVDQRLGNVLCEGPHNKYFRFFRPSSRSTAIHFCHCNKCSHRQCVNESLWLCFTHTLFTQKDGELDLVRRPQFAVLDGIVHLQFKLLASNLNCNKWL